MIINNKQIPFVKGETILQAAKTAGIEIPSLCAADGHQHQASCMVCVVKDLNSGQMIPSCTTKATENMKIDANSNEIQTMRKTSLELLLSDHPADCEAPCSIACPASMDVAEMNRLIMQDRKKDARLLLTNTLVLPALLCNICKAPCEWVCHRKDIDSSINIREIKTNLVINTLYQGSAPAINGQRVLIQGSSLSALSAAWTLRHAGYAVDIYESEDVLLTPYIDASKVDATILKHELQLIQEMGIRMRTNEEFHPEQSEGYDLFIPHNEGLLKKAPAIQIRLGREEANKAQGIEQPQRQFNSKRPKYRSKSEIEHLPSTESTHEATRCLLCDCNAKTDCRLRNHASTHQCKPKLLQKNCTTPTTINKKLTLEPSKCVKCGLCVYNSNGDFTFEKRGFEMKISCSSQNKENINLKIANLCPTGALNRK